MSTKKTILSSGIANTFEWYDYILFAHFAPILGRKFFPDDDPTAPLLNAFTLFAAGYFMRPFGGVFFGVLGDKFGRRASLSASIMCMSVPTMAIGFLPTYESIGITATILMTVARMIQGLSMGGALTGSISFSIEHAPKNHRGLIGSIAMSSICLGILLGSIVIYGIKLCMSSEEFYNFGWRIPFLLGIFIIIAGYYIRRNTKETPLFEEIKQDGQISSSPIREVLKNHWFDMIISICINSTGSVVFYTQAIYLMNFLKENRGFPALEVDNMLNISYIIMAFVTLFVGWLSDIIGRSRIYIINLGVIASSCFFIMRVFESGDIDSVMIMQIFLAILAAAYIGPEPALQASFYPTRVRNTALSLSYNIATSIFGGTTPLVLVYLLQVTGTVVSWAYYILGCSVISMVALYFYKNRMKEDDDIIRDKNVRTNF